MAGVTFLAFGNGSPDVFSTFAAMSSHSGSLAVGELIGAAGFITAVVAGSMALVREFRVGKKTFVRDVGFFIIATSFSIAFLSDGALHMWECCVMIGFYLFYVVVVVVWHWYLGRRRRRREREAAARGHYLAMTNEEIEISEEDGDDEDAPAGERAGRYRDAEDFEALERAGSPAFDTYAENESDEDGDQGMHIAAEMASSMRVLRPAGSRKNTITAIRPSLVGALEFRSVLSALQKSRGSHKPIHLRRYSDDPNSHDGASDVWPYLDNDSDIVVTTAQDSGLGILGSDTPSRLRAVSMNDAEASRQTDPAAYTLAHVPNIGVVAATPTIPSHLDVHSSGSFSGGHSWRTPVPQSPTISVTRPASDYGISIHSSRDVSPISSQDRPKFDDRLAPPGEGFPGARHLRVDIFNDLDGANESAKLSPHDSPKTKSRESQRPRLEIPGPSSRESSCSRKHSPLAQFPAYSDSPLAMSPLPMTGHDSKPPSLLLLDARLTESEYIDSSRGQHEKHIKWWPYWLLPSPYILSSTLFPTLCRWREKNWWDKFVGTLSAPSIFLLAITLPVVESESPGEEEEQEEVNAPAEDRRNSTMGRKSTNPPVLTPDSPSLEAEPEWLRFRRATEHHSPRLAGHRGFSGHSTASVAISAEHHHHHLHSLPMPSKPQSINQIDISRSDLSPSSSGNWNRWLVAVQIFTAPLFVVTIVWANTDEGDKRLLVKLVLYSLLGSLIAFAILVLTTTPSKPPKYRFLLCFLGFIVSISWISTIASEVVGVLKAFGVILGISDAILGLTIFAVGNSLGDLVADITVARLGYPVMALSACFGGPMLNILLGIGISGLYMTINEADKKHYKHPNRKIKYKPYQVEVSGTLMISAITLLVTLVGLLIVVPMNKWMMTRKIGWGLIILWTISTVVNLAVEITGFWGNVAFSL